MSDQDVKKENVNDGVAANNDNINTNGTTASNEPAAEENVEADASLLRKILRSKLVENNNIVEIEQKNPDSPLYSAKTFEELNLKKELLQGIYAMGFTRPSKIQETALPALINNPPQNLIAQSQSGTGKTAAFVLSMLSRIDSKLAYPQVVISKFKENFSFALKLSILKALCLAPTMELAIQIAEVVKKMGQFIPEIMVVLAVKGQMVTSNVIVQNQIVIGTPGTVLDWAYRFKAIDLKKIKVFVLDEADVMLATQGHHDFSHKIVRGLHHNCQMMLFSATYTNSVIEFALKIIKKPMIIRLRRQEESLNYIKQFYVICNDYESKCKAFYNIYGFLTVGQAIVFCESRKAAHNFAVRLNNDKISCELLTSDLSIDQRASVFERFRAGKSKVLVATNIAARGLDIEDINIVFNFDLPLIRNTEADFETYLHRIGRTGRFGKVGVAVNLIDSSQLSIVEKIERHFSIKIKKIDANDPEAIDK